MHFGMIDFARKFTFLQTEKINFMKVKKVNLKCLLFFAMLSIMSISHATNDSTQYKSFTVGYYMLNDNDPISNQKGYDARNRDDHGLTFLLQMNAEAKLSLMKNTQTTIRFESYCGLFTKGFGTLTKLPKQMQIMNTFPTF